MIILGLNYGHDSGVTIIKNSKILFAVNEERLSRKKLHIGFPYKSVFEGLKKTNIKINQINLIYIEGKSFSPMSENDLLKNNWKKFFSNIFGLDSFFLGTKIGIKIASYVLFFSTFFKKKKIKYFFTQKGFKGEFKFIDHHLAHASSAYYIQPNDEGLCITMDASGEGYCSRVYKCKNNKMKLLHSIECYKSPGYYYAYITQLLGFRPLRHEGKILGLAAHGNGEKVRNILRRFIYFDKKKITFINLGGHHDTLYNRLKKNLNSFKKKDIAAGIQIHLEDLVMNYISHIIKKFYDNKPTNLFLSGGVFANVKLNQLLAKYKYTKDIFVTPNMGDGGLNLGCALIANKKKIDLKHVYTGKIKFDYTCTENYKKRIKVLKPKNKFNFISEQLSKKKIIAVCNGNMEFGPRALGNRSIICSAKNKKINNFLNKKLKRTEFMPFAPIVLAEDFDKYFYKNKKINTYKFMTFTCKVKKKCIDQAPAVVHVDNTARPQVVEKNSNLFLYKILKSYKKKTGCGILINTSFNIHEEPIVFTFEDAIKSLLYSSLDYLVNDEIIIKNKLKK